MVGMVTGIVSAVTGVIGVFQAAKQEKTLNAIEHNTRYSMMFLGERGDGGIVGAALMTVERLGYVNDSFDGLNAKIDRWLEPTKVAVESISSQLSLAQTRLDEISSNTFWSLRATQDNATHLAEIRDMMIAEKTAPPAAWTVTFAGDPIARLVGDEIMRQLRLQGVNLK
jgi:hypothetical protein